MRYPPIEPYDAGLLEVGDGQRVYWEVCGDPGGKPALVVHGGPGSGCTPGLRTWFDPDRYRVVLFDQRGCGRSRPHASEPDVDLTANTTAHLLADMERLRDHLDVGRWLLFGGSWGATLSLAYAVQHPERVSEAVIVAVTTGRHSEVDWVSDGVGDGVGAFFPQARERRRAALPERLRVGDVAGGYAQLLADPDPAVHEPAARAWCDWEDAIIRLGDDVPSDPRYDDPRFRLAFARLVTHYFANRLFLADGVLLAGAAALGDIPAVLVHGGLDLQGPLDNAWQLHRAWPGSELVVVGAGGHGRGPGMEDALFRALDGFADRG